MGKEMRPVILICLVFGCFMYSAADSQTGKRTAPVQSHHFTWNEFEKRGGLPNLFYKIKTQRQIKIAYLGGSITGANEGWRSLSFDWFRLRYPLHSFYQINGAVGGTGSLLGALRIDSILAQKPDLVFVEFAVNDENDMSVSRRVQAMEGIVRKTWTALPNTDICFVYTTAKKFCDSLMQFGKRMDAVVDHEKIAAHYGIPSIDMSLEIVRLADEGKLLLSADPAENAHHIVFWGSGDDYHPLPESGHAVYAGVVTKYLERMSRQAAIRNHVLPKPFARDHWQISRMIYPSQARMSGNWVRFDDAVKDSLAGPVPALYRGSPGAQIDFAFSGTELGIYDIIGPGSGGIEITVDGITQSITRFNHNCFFWHRHHVFLNSLAQGRHEVSIRVSRERFDKTPVMKKTDDPAKYADYDWYPVAILVVGEPLQGAQ